MFLCCRMDFSANSDLYPGCAIVPEETINHCYTDGQAMCLNLHGASFCLLGKCAMQWLNTSAVS